MQTQEKVNKIINLIEKFIFDDTPDYEFPYYLYPIKLKHYGFPSKFLKPKKEISFSRKEFERLIDEIAEHFGLNENDLEILDDEVTFVIPGDHYKFEREDGVYGITTEVRLKFKKENGSLKLVGVELAKSIDQLY